MLAAGSMRASNPLVNVGKPLLNEISIKPDPRSEIQRNQSRSGNGAYGKRQDHTSPGVHVESPNSLAAWGLGVFVAEAHVIEQSQASMDWL
jgi:hypothetical protein